MRGTQTASSDEQCIPSRCIWKCGAACFHDAPNEDGRRSSGAPFAEVAARRFGRRALLKSAAAATPALLLAGTPAGAALLGDSPFVARRAEAAATTGASLGFSPIALNEDDTVTVPSGYTATVLMRWGDPIHAGGTRMTIENASRALQEQTFGYNADLNAFFPLATHPGGRTARGVLAVNHEYTEAERMFTSPNLDAPSANQVDTEIAAHGMSILELSSTSSGVWSVNLSSPLNRRITGFTEMEITGPLRGDDRLKTSADPTGTHVLGMLNNCAGGKTPWGTVLTAEENFHQYFANNDEVADEAQKAIGERYGVPCGASDRLWETVHDRFDLAKEPNEINRFGYIVEIDPHDPTFVPKKRTALGRTKHEAANGGLTNDGRVAFYSGDDERFDYLYKFVTAGKYNPAHRKSNFSLLDSGTLYVAKFHEDGTGTWLPLVGGEAALASWSHADVLLNTRGAGDAVGATPMDRPEDVEVNPRNNRVYVALTNNTRREEGDEDAVNPRANNRFGHVIEISEDGGDLGATGFTWEVFLLAGPSDDDSRFFAGFDTAEVSDISCPDNVAFDSLGNLWIATDGQPGTISRNDTVFAVPTAGPQRGNVQPFLSVPRGAEVCGPEFTPDMQTLFVNVQHPGEASDGPDNPQSVWPDGIWPPLPSLVVVTKAGGGRIGT